MDAGATAPLREALDAAVPERPFSVRLWDGTVLESPNGGPTFTVRSPQALGHILRAPGQLGVGRAYVSGGIEVDDMDEALALIARWSPPPIDNQAKLAISASASSMSSTSIPPLT